MIAKKIRIRFSLNEYSNLQNIISVHLQSYFFKSKFHDEGYVLNTNDQMFKDIKII